MNTHNIASLPSPPTTLLSEAALFLDFDGTLVELVDDPDGVEVPDSLLALLSLLAELLDGRLAIVSGRNCERLDRFGLGAYLRAGSHGLEIQGPGEVICLPERHHALDDILVEARAFAETRPGVVIEPKPFSVGIHYRQAPHFGDDAEILAETLAAPKELFVQKGKLMAEIRPVDGNKGKAIERMMKSPAFADHKPVFLGDDTTDEDGFIAARKMGGHGIFVGHEGETAARWKLDDVTSVRDWLTRCTVQLQGERSKA